MVEQRKLTDDATVTVWDNGLVATVPTEVFLSYEERPRSIIALYAPDAPYALKNAILRFALEARLSGTMDRPAALSPVKGDGQ